MPAPYQQVPSSTSSTSSQKSGFGSFFNGLGSLFKYLIGKVDIHTPDISKLVPDTEVEFLSKYSKYSQISTNGQSIEFFEDSFDREFVVRYSFYLESFRNFKKKSDLSNPTLIKEALVEYHDFLEKEYDKVYQNILEFLRKDGKQDYNVVLTGHFFGGALATKHAYKLLQSGKLNQNQNQISLVTFGSPKVGNDAFARFLEKSGMPIYRVVREFDIVAQFPFDNEDFRHVGDEIWIHNQEFYTCPQTLEKTCSRQTINMYYAYDEYEKVYMLSPLLIEAFEKRRKAKNEPIREKFAKEKQLEREILSLKQKTKNKEQALQTKQEENRQFKKKTIDSSAIKFYSELRDNWSHPHRRFNW